jgi:predicted nucleic acid-binding protein
MSRLILLDAGPLGMVANPKGNDEARRCKAWLNELIAARVQVMVPEGADFEVRRGLVLDGSRGGLDRLDKIGNYRRLLPMTSTAWRRAAVLWAEARKGGYATADDKELDCDILLAAQAQIATEDGYDAIVATGNLRHLTRFVDARLWETITV